MHTYSGITSVQTVHCNIFVLISHSCLIHVLRHRAPRFCILSIAPIRFTQNSCAILLLQNAHFKTFSNTTKTQPSKSQWIICIDHKLQLSTLFDQFQAFYLVLMHSPRQRPLPLNQRSGENANGI